MVISKVGIFPANPVRTQRLLSEHPLACPKCNGRGRYNDYDLQIMGVAFSTYKGDAICVHCKGKGYHPIPFTELYDIKEGPISWHKVKK